MTEIEYLKLIPKVIKELKKNHIAAIAKDTGFDDQTLTKIMDKTTKRPRKETIEALVKYFEL